MSVKVMTWVWDHSKSRGSARLVLLAIADCAAEDGGNAYPSMAELVRKAGLSERAVQTAIASLIALGELDVAHNKGKGRCNLYRVLMTNPAGSAPRRICTPQDLHPAGSAPKPPQDLHPNPAESAPGTVLEPSVEPPPSPPSPKPAASALVGATGEGENLDEITGELQGIRRGFARGAIRAELQHCMAEGRDLRVIAEAARIVFAAPETRAPGRLRTGGPWWAEAERRVIPRHTPHRDQTEPQWRHDLAARTPAGEDHPARQAARAIARRAAAA